MVMQNYSRRSNCGKLGADGGQGEGAAWNCPYANDGFVNGGWTKTKGWKGKGWHNTQEMGLLTKFLTSVKL
ncbi:hypothetical protein TcasGA2_TC016014 [Tribolium castaneum]|uniref:Uncharacterized protein n=1 Tax=Tribolium castaneum TaxID=7070 RepID=D2CG13_TRICA|nr:hypothetical protein TcasGA2_TC016014 [Tribolium castaneum]